MATHAQDDRSATREMPSGWYAFAGALLVIVGSLNILQGFIALLKDDYFAVTKAGLLFSDFSAWGTFFLIVGIIELLVGLGIFALKTWARGGFANSSLGRWTGIESINSCEKPWFSRRIV